VDYCQIKQTQKATEQHNKSCKHGELGCRMGQHIAQPLDDAEKSVYPVGGFVFHEKRLLGIFTKGRR
jgi:hypothetical protein